MSQEFFVSLFAGVAARARPAEPSKRSDTPPCGPHGPSRLSFRWGCEQSFRSLTYSALQGPDCRFAAGSVLIRHQGSPASLMNTLTGSFGLDDLLSFATASRSWPRNAVLAPDHSPGTKRHQSITMYALFRASTQRRFLPRMWAQVTAGSRRPEALLAGLCDPRRLAPHSSKIAFESWHLC